MSTGVISPRADQQRERVPSRVERRLERRRLARQDAVAARLAELHRMRALLQQAAVVVSTGWVQNAWFSVVDGRGRAVALTAYDVDRTTEEPVSGACLVGGIVHAAGGPRTVHSQLVQRTLDLTWHALHEGEQARVRWCPAPPVRAAHVRDLTRWNDDPRRTARHVRSLLDRAVRVVDLEIASARTSARALAATA